MTLAVAERYLDAGLCVLPAVRMGDSKRVDLREWKPYQTRPPTREELATWFGGGTRDLCVVCGAVSGNLEVIDFDLGGEAFEPWRSMVGAAAPGLVERLVIESTPSGGRHAVYRCETPVGRSAKLASKRIEADGPGQLVIGSKQFRPRRDAEGRWHVMVTTIETRGEGGVFLCAPSDGYALIQGDLRGPPVVTADERDVLLGCAWALDEMPPPVVDGPAGAGAPQAASGHRPGDDFNERGDPRETLLKHGWALAKAGENEHWRRPGKAAGTSATLKDRVFYVFSTNAPPFEAHKGYSPFAVYALLEHNGDFSAAAAALRARGFGGGQIVGDVDLSAFTGTRVSGTPAPGLSDPGPVPPSLLRVPGFIDDVIDYTLSNAPYPEPVLALCGAVALQATLAGRRVRDPQDNRTAVYLLGLANTGTGKDFPRRVNQRILAAAGMPGAFADGFASGEGLEDRMFLQPVMLFQTDEIDALMQAISGRGRRDPRYEGIMQTLLKLYTSAGSVYPLRVRANDPAPRTIDQPCLCLFGTAVPDTFYEALSPKMLSNGFFARMLVLEAGRRGSGRDADVRDLPAAILKRARWWAELPPGAGNPGAEHPGPRVVPATPGARDRLAQVRGLADAAYAGAESRGDQAGMALWARANEKARRLALVHACSASHRRPQITPAAVDWAWALVDHQTRCMLFKAGQHVSAGDFESKCKALVRALHEWAAKHPRDPWMPYWRLSRRLAWSPREHEEVRQALLDQRRIHYTEKATGGTPQRLYRLAKDGESA